MTFAPTPKQALFLWKMICAESSELRQPLRSKATPKLDAAKERRPLVLAGFLEEVPGAHGGQRLTLTDAAWRWAAECADLELMKSNSRDGAIALEGLVRALLPFLKSQGLALADIIRARDTSPSSAAKAAELVQSRDRATSAKKTPERNHAQPSTDDGSLESRIRHTCNELTGHDPTRAIRLSALRAALPGVARHTLDLELRRMQQAGSVALYRDDNTTQVTQQDTRDALMVGDEPRHLFYLKD